MNIDELERLARAAHERSPGPWTCENSLKDADGAWLCEYSDASAEAWTREDEFVAAANPAAVLELIERLRLAEQRLEFMIDNGLYIEGKTIAGMPDMPPLCRLVDFIDGPIDAKLYGDPIEAIDAAIDAQKGEQHAEE